MLFTFSQKIRYSVKLLDFQSEQIQTNSVDFQFSMYHNHHFAFHFNISQQIHLARSRESFHCKKLNTFMESLTQNISISSKIFRTCGTGICPRRILVLGILRSVRRQNLGHPRTYYRGHFQLQTWSFW